ncbi:TPA: hypothetical protein IAB29_02960 [Candidatus Ventrenecus stercoripullorum]|nr:hypothetical protein [Candidatus Ventrenecus stercoripullorum]
MKKAKIKQRRRLALLLIIILIIALVLFFLFRRKDYTVTYSVNDYEITESYHKEEDYYSFIIKKGETERFAIVYNQHFSSKKNIDQITEYQTETESCITISSNKVRIEPLCTKEATQISYHLVSDEMKEKLGVTSETKEDTILTTYNNINVYHYRNHNYYIWNYRGFYHINENTTENIQLFDKDIYNPTLITQVNDTLVIPDYNADYYFDKVILLDMNTGRTTTWTLETSIYFDSAVLGVYQGDLYIIDKHEKTEWQLNIAKQKQERVGTEQKGGKIYDHEWTNVTMNRLLYQENTFKGTTILEYNIKEDGLYAIFDNHQMKIRESAPSKILSNTDNTVYYLVNDNVYSYNKEEGEKLLLNYFEWNFNSENVIFID